MNINRLVLAALAALALAAGPAQAQTERSQSAAESYDAAQPSTPSFSSPGQIEEDLRDASGARPVPSPTPGQTPGSTYQGGEEGLTRSSEAAETERRGKGWLVAGGLALALIVFFMTRRRRLDTDKHI